MNSSDSEVDVTLKVKVLVTTSRGTKEVNFENKNVDMRRELKLTEQEELEIFDTDFGEFVAYAFIEGVDVKALGRYRIVNVEGVSSKDASAGGAAGRSR